MKFIPLSYSITMISLVLSSCSIVVESNREIESKQSKPNKSKLIEKKKSGCVAGNCINGKGKFQRLYKHTNTIHEIKEGKLLNGKLNGKGKKTFYTDQEVVDNIETGGYINDKRHGEITYTRYYNGEKTYISISHYVNGKLEGLRSTKSYTHGKLRTESITQYKNGKKHGKDIFISYNNTGKHQRVNHYVNGNFIKR